MAYGSFGYMAPGGLLGGMSSAGLGQTGTSAMMQSQPYGGMAPSYDMSQLYSGLQSYFQNMYQPQMSSPSYGASGGIAGYGSSGGFNEMGAAPATKPGFDPNQPGLTPMPSVSGFQPGGYQPGLTPMPSVSGFDQNYLGGSPTFNESAYGQPQLGGQMPSYQPPAPTPPAPQQRPMPSGLKPPQPSGLKPPQPSGLKPPQPPSMMAGITPGNFRVNMGVANPMLGGNRGGYSGPRRVF